MRILVASPYLPWPLQSGGQAAQFSTLKCMASDHQFTLVCPVYAETCLRDAEELQSQLPTVIVRPVLCGHAEPDRSLRGATLRGFRWAAKQGKRLLTTKTTSRIHPSAEADRLSIHYPFDRLPRAFITAIGEELAKEYDLLQAEFAEMLPLGGWFPNRTPKLFVHHQIHSIYTHRFLATHGRDTYIEYLASLMKMQEDAYLKRFDGVITFSQQDRNALAGSLPEDDLFVSPFPIPVDVGYVGELPQCFDGRYLFVASEEHAPNRDALEWMLKEIWPEILRQLPASRLVVVGKWSDSTAARLAAPGVNFVGFVTNLSETLRGGTLLVPLRIGSGIRVKIMAAMAEGVPVVSTSIGSEGMPFQSERDLLVRDNAADFAAAAVQLSRVPMLWHQLANQGRAAVNTHYSPENVRQKRNEIYTCLARRHRTG